MPTYSYQCDKCKNDFELFFYIKDYIPTPSCPNCKSKKTHRSYTKDVITQSASVRKADSELKTVGDLANRNRDRMSEDHKIALHNKHNDYKYDTPQTQLPKGMKRIKKQPKIKWT
jgi:putative FmdB family regulatory protein